MDDERARQRLLEGGYFAALGVPPGVEFGIDLKSYQTGPQFQGVKMIPPGLHLAHYGTGEGEKQGFFFRSAARSVAATQWDASSEDLINSEACLSEGSLRSLRDSVLRLEMEANLGPYPFDQRKAWVNLTNCISESVLERCGIYLGEKVLAGSSAVEVETEGGRDGSGMEVVPYFPHVGRVARYCEVPGRVTAACLKNGGQGAGGTQVDPQEITRRNMDQSQALRDLISGNFGGKWTELLGEMQLSFVLFVSLSSLRGFRHWQAVCALLCQCGDALGTHPALFVAFIRMLHAQLKLVPEDFFEAEISRENFLVVSLSALVQNILPSDDCCPLSPTLVDAAERLVKFLRQRFGLFDTRMGKLTAPSATMRTDFDEDAALWGDDQSSDEETGVSTSVEALAVERVENRLSLMRRLELSEEDRPAVVPYEEVTRVLGAGAFVEEGVPEQSGVCQKPAVSMQVDEPSPAQSSEDVMGKTLQTATTGGTEPEDRVGTEAKPSEQHAQRWREIDCLLSASTQPSSSPSSSTSHVLASRRPRMPNPSAETGNGHLAVLAVAAGGRLAAAARRYPLLFASTSPKEDLMMASARLLFEQGESNAAAKAQAMGFLEELEASEDQGAAFLRLSVVAPPHFGVGDV